MIFNTLQICYLVKDFFPFIDKPSSIYTQITTLNDNISKNILSVSHEGGLLSTDISDHLPVFVFLMKVDYCQQISVTTFLFLCFS